MLNAVKYSTMSDTRWSSIFLWSFCIQFAISM